MLDYKIWATSPTFACRHYICKVFSEKRSTRLKCRKLHDYNTEAAYQLQKFVPHVPVTNPHPHVKLLYPSKKILPLPLSLISMPQLGISSWKNYIFLNKQKIKKLSTVHYFPVQTETFPKTFLPHYPSPHPPNENSIVIYTFVQALLC